MNVVIGTVKTLTGEFFAKNSHGDIVELHVGDKITKDMVVFGAEGNSADASIKIGMLNLEEAITLTGLEKQTFDMSLVDDNNIDDLLSPSSLKAALNEDVDALDSDNTEEEGILDDTEAGEEQAVKGQSVDDVFAARNGEEVDVSSSLRNAKFNSSQEVEPAQSDDIFPRVVNVITPPNVVENTAPDITNTTATVDVVENETVVGNYAATDAESDTITYTLTGTDAALFNIDNAGNVSFITAPDYDAGQTGPYSINVVATDDGEGTLSDTQAVTISVTNVNDNQPVAVNDLINATEDTQFTSTIELDANDTDLDGDALSVTAGTFTTAQGGEIVLAADGSYTYTPASNFSGIDTFDYTVTDGLLTDVGTLTISVTAVADAPSLTLSPSSVTESTAFDEVTFSGSWTPYADVTSLMGGIWRTDNSDGQVELGLEDTYLGNGVTDNTVIELERYSGDASNIYTTITAKTGENYTIDFDYSPRGGSLTDSVIEVFWNGELVATLDSQTIGFVHHSIDLTVPMDGDYKLEFKATDSDSTGGLLDNIMLTQTYNVGVESMPIALSNISSALVDIDGSEVLSLMISDIPLGATLSDGTNIFIADVSTSNAVVTNWDLNNLTLNVPNVDVVTTYTLNVIATSTESLNSDSASTTLPLDVTVAPVTPVVIDYNNQDISSGLTTDIGDDNLFNIDDIRADGTVVNMLGGDDIISVNDDIKDDVVINMGDGNDTITVGDRIQDGAIIDMGAGDDVINMGASIRNTALVDGDTGFDTITLKNDSIDFTQIANIEKLDLGVNGDHTVDLSLNDILQMTDSGNTLEISGDASDTLNLDISGWTPGTITSNTIEQTITYEYASGTDSITLTVDDQIDTTVI